jgi:hypothetical protein
MSCTLIRLLEIFQGLLFKRRTFETLVPDEDPVHRCTQGGEGGEGEPPLPGKFSKNLLIKMQ